MNQFESTNIQESGDLFVAVQTSGIFKDSKTFVDAVPKGDPTAILAAYQREQGDAEFDLKRFVETHFELPPCVPVPQRPTGTMEEYIESTWDSLTLLSREQNKRCNLVSVDYPHLIPGDRFREPYYWDSAFCFECLVEFPRHVERAFQMVWNFDELVEAFGYVPNGFRTYYLTRSQPPMLARMARAYRRLIHSWQTRDLETYYYHYTVGLAMTILEPEIHQSNPGWPFLSMLEKEYAFWMNGALSCPDNAANERVVRQGVHLLNRYWDSSNHPRPESYKEDVATVEAAGVSIPGELCRHIRAAAESGWDFSSRWFADYQTLSTIRTTKIIPVDLNALLYSLESELSTVYEIVGNSKASQTFRAKAEQRRDEINAFHWNEEHGFYFDYDFEKQRQTPVASLAAVFPLMCEVADNHQAELVRRKLESEFLKDGGLVATLTEDTNQQWDYPNAWAPLQFAAVSGLRSYAKYDAYSDPFFKLAFQIAARFHKCAREFYNREGLMMEKYNAVNTAEPGTGGEYRPQTGFGWTNAVVMYFQNFLECQHAMEELPEFPI